MTDKQTAIKSIILRVLFIIAIVVVIFILAFAIIRFLPMVFSGFASVGNALTSSFKSKEVDVSVNDASLLDGDPFELSWSHESKDPGYYILTYACANNLKINALESVGKKTILCNTRYALPENAEKIQLEAQFDTVDSFIDVPLEVSFVDASNDNIEARGEVVITIQNDTNPTPIGTNAGATITSSPVSNTTSPSNNTSSGSNNTNPIVVSPSIPADLAIINADAISDLKVQFVIKNIGGKNTGTWVFTYSTPGEGTETSPTQPNLRPGESIKYTLTFDAGTPDGTVSIKADSTNSISENSESNNTASIKINGDDSDIGNIDNDFDEDDDADLEIAELEVGRMNGSKFVEDDSIDSDDDAAIRFVVVNRGGEDTGSWKFSVDNLPYDNDDNYESKKQDSLDPGEYVEIIVEFENPDEGDYDIKVEVDSDDDVDEEKENNNDETENLEIED